MIGVRTKVLLSRLVTLAFVLGAAACEAPTIPTAKPTAGDANFAVATSSRQTTTLISGPQRDKGALSAP
jgi:hypothetical protein